MNQPMSGEQSANQDDLRARAEEARERWAVPGLAVGVLDDGQATSFGLGVASLETGQPVTANTLFQIGSITKVFTATLVMRLVEDGLLDLDTPVASYLPELRLADDEARRTITLRHLLSHSSGLEGDYFNHVGPRYGFGDDALPRAIADFDQLRQLNRPGEVWAYCNAGFHLSAAVIERVIGQKYEAAMRERIFAPLGLERSFFFAHEAIVYPYAVGHNQTVPGGDEHEVARVYPRPRCAHAAGAIISTVGDLLRFAAFHISDGQMDGEPLLSPASLAAMRAPQVRAGNFADHYGIGWALQSRGGVTVVSHGGTTNGFQAQLALVPERGFAIAALTNSSRGAAAYREIVDWALEQECGIAREEPAPLDISLSELERFAGNYRSPFTRIAVSVAGHGLRFDVASRNLAQQTETAMPPVFALPTGENEFTVMEGETRGARIDFIPGDAGHPRFVRFGGRLCDRSDADGAA